MIAYKGTQDITVATYVGSWEDALKLVTNLPMKYPDYRVDRVSVQLNSREFDGGCIYFVDIKLSSNKAIDL